MKTNKNKTFCKNLYHQPNQKIIAYNLAFSLEKFTNFEVEIEVLKQTN